MSANAINTRHAPSPIGIIAGVEFEAAVIKKHFAAAVAGGDILIGFSGPGNRQQLNRIFDDQRARGATAFISFGVAGGLAPDLKPGTLVIPPVIVTPEDDRPIPCDAAWHAKMCDWLKALQPVTQAPLLTTRQAVTEPVDKHHLYRKTGALSVDMESAIIASAAQAYGLPFVALRVIADPADQSLPASALAGMDTLGRLDVMKCILALAAAPGEIPAVMRLARHSKAAQVTLAAICRQLPALTLLQP